MGLACLGFILKLLTVTSFIVGSRSETNVCLQKYFENVMSDGSSLPTENIVSSHDVQSMASCFMLCFEEKRCVGFNYRLSKSRVDPVNCQLSNKLKSRIVSGNDNGEWDFYEDLEMMNKTGRINNEGGEQMPSTGQPHSNSTCTTLRQKNSSLPSGWYFVNPGNLQFEVYCDMDSKNDTGVTVIGHDSEPRTLVDGDEYDNPGSYSRKIQYNITMEQIVAVINQSRNCEQFIKYECSSSLLLYSSFGWWVSRRGKKMNYWGGAAVDSGKCACGMTNTCVGGGNCNCDVNDKVLREDSGFLTDKNTLPVTELRFGDAGIGARHDEHGYHTLGKLLCWG